MGFQLNPIPLHGNTSCKDWLCKWTNMLSDRQKIRVSQKRLAKISWCFQNAVWALDWYSLICLIMDIFLKIVLSKSCLGSWLVFSDMLGYGSILGDIDWWIIVLSKCLPGSQLVYIWCAWLWIYSWRYWFMDNSTFKTFDTLLVIKL